MKTTYLKLTDLVPGDMYANRNNSLGRVRLLIYRTDTSYGYMTPDGHLHEYAMTSAGSHLEYFKHTETLISPNVDQLDED